MSPRTFVLLLSFVLLACDSEPFRLGVDQPIFVHNGQLRDGKLPGSRASDDQGPDPKSAQITSFSLGFGVLLPGTPNATVSGRTNGKAYAVGLRFLDLGDGYWLVPAGAEDPANPTELSFELAFDAAIAIEPGLHDLAVVAFDENGKAGQQSVLSVCVGSDIPDNLNSCNPETAPPIAVTSLSWNADSDLDLIIVAPNGQRFDRSNRLLLDNGMLDAAGKPLAGLDRDGSTACLKDGRRRESFVWNAEPAQGDWLVYANLFDACGAAAVSFELTTYRSQHNEDGSYELVPDAPVHGELVRAQQNGGAGAPLYLGSVKF